MNLWKYMVRLMMAQVDFSWIKLKEWTVSIWFEIFWNFTKINIDNF